MSHASLKGVILCGGIGTRLWPLSRPSLPKQFIDLGTGVSLLSDTLSRLNFCDEFIAVGLDEHRYFMLDTLKQSNKNFRLMLEPVSKNTCAAMALVALQSGPEDLLLFVPSDHHMPDINLFRECVLSCVSDAEQGNFVLLGISPHEPNTGYGYIKATAEKPNSECLKVESFIEKPNVIDAKKFIQSGQYFWNAGIFLVQSKVLVEALQIHVPNIWHAVADAVRYIDYDDYFIRPSPNFYDEMDSISIDHGVIEKIQNICVKPYLGVWSDLGSWKSVAKKMGHHALSNTIYGQGQVVNGVNNFIYGSDRTVIVYGLDQLAVIDTPDVTMITTLDKTEQLKDLLATLDPAISSKINETCRIYRPWGWYERIAQGSGYQTKKIHVKPGASLSLQMHHHRSEHWVVVSGHARVEIEDQQKDLFSGESTFIPVASKHRLSNPSKISLEIIEIQLGEYLSEDDIVRFEDQYGRS